MSGDHGDVGQPVKIRNERCGVSRGVFGPTPPAKASLEGRPRWVRSSCGRHDRHTRLNRRRIEASPVRVPLRCAVLHRRVVESCVIAASFLDADRGRLACTLDEIPVDPLCGSPLSRTSPLRRTPARPGGVMSRRVLCPFPCKTP